MKKIHRVLVLLLAALMALSLITTAFAEPTIDPGKKASLSIYKYDITMPARTARGTRNPMSAPACMTMPLSTSWQNTPCRAWSLPTSAWPTLP